jgi:hypothetical protein
MEIPKHIKYKKTITISRWRDNLGLKLKEGETYDNIYQIVQNTTNCQLCNVELCDGKKSNSRTMDHSHDTGYFRMVLCRRCNAGYKRELQKNNKTGIRYINQFDNGWRYQAKDKSFSKYSTNKQIVLWAKFIHQKIEES